MPMLVVDVLALIMYALVSLPALTGIAVHEWLGLAVFVVLAVHLVQNCSRVFDTACGLARGFSMARMGRLVLDVLLAAALMVVVVSGIMISGAVLPAFGLYAEGYYFWDPLHAIAAKVLLALLLVHVVLNARMAHRLWGRIRGRAKEEIGDDTER